MIRTRQRRGRVMSGNRLSPPAGEVHLYYADLGLYHVTRPETQLSPDESARAGRYRFEADSRRYIQARCLLREVLSFYRKCPPEEIIFEYAHAGKPFLKGEPPAGVQFSISHAGAMVAVAVSRGRRVGVDIEMIRDDIPASDLSLRFFSGAEAAAVRNSQGRAKTELFFRIWTRKEAFLKATGEGIGGLPGCPALPGAGDISLDGTAWQVRDLEIAPGYIAALATEGTGVMVRTGRFPAEGVRPGIFMDSGE
jgi:4'-phosphopantetheinyl transferase